MSLSKLESLPNELLCDIIEKYINGVDLLVAFNYQLNRRFDALIAQSPRFSFNFIHCRKDDFRFCMGLLPAYIDKIEELAISEQDTPGQVYAFLTFFPSFASFKYLRRLHFHFHNGAADWTIIERAFLSLFNTNIDTLWIKVTNIKNMSSLDSIILDLFRLKSLKRLSLSSDSMRFYWNHLKNISSGIEYLTISGTNCGIGDLQYIFQCTSRLKYLNIRTTSKKPFFPNEKEKNRKNKIVPMFELRTLILTFPRGNTPVLNQLSQYFNNMPVLNRLEIRGHSNLFDADAWEMLLKTSLPLLTHFSLQTTTFDFVDVEFHDVLATFQGLFWKSKKNFNVIITEHKSSNFMSRDIYDMYDNAECEFDLPVVQWWTAPDRTINDNFIITDKIMSLRLCDLGGTLSRNHCFDKVKYLAVDHMNMRLLKWVTTCINCSQTMELVINNSLKKTNALISFLTYFTNINSLRISYDLLMATKDAFVGKDNRLKHLDISFVEHMFNQKDIIVIAKLFPYVEHIKINTTSLHKIPLLKIHLPYLRSLTFEIADRCRKFYDDHTEVRRYHELFLQTRFFFHFNTNSITVWIDQEAFQDPYWQKYVVKSSQSSATSVTIGSTNEKKKSKFSFLNLFK